MANLLLDTRYEIKYQNWSTLLTTTRHIRVCELKIDYVFFLVFFFYYVEHDMTSKR